MTTQTIESPVKIHRPRPRSGQIILAVNLSEVADGTRAIATLMNMGYAPQLRLYQFKTGVGVLAVLKDEQLDQTPDDDYLMDEWLELNGLYGNSGAILWRGKVQAGEIAA